MNVISTSDARDAIIDALRGSGMSEKDISDLSHILYSDVGKLITAAFIAAISKR